MEQGLTSAMIVGKSSDTNPHLFSMRVSILEKILMFAVTVAASMCFASPFSTPPNALVMSAGQYTFMDYVKIGLPLQILMGIVMVFVLPLLFPF